jgi:tetratricopeptide (TPR) repeat protein
VHENITASVLENGGVIRAEPVIIHHYGYACETYKRARKAAAYLDIAAQKTQTRPDDPKSWHDYAELALSCGRIEEAESALRHALRLEPRHVAASMTLTTIHLNRGELDAADAILRGLAAHRLIPPHGLAALGGIALRRGRLQEADNFLRAALVIAPGTITARLLVARVYDCSERPADAAAELKQCLRLAPASLDVQNRVHAHETRLAAERRYIQGENNEALALLTQSLRLDPDDPITYNNIGVVLAAMGLPQEATKKFQQALTLVADLPQAKANLALLSP